MSASHRWLVTGAVVAVVVAGLTTLGVLLLSTQPDQGNDLVPLGVTAEKPPAQVAAPVTNGSTVDAAWVRRVAASSGIPGTAIDAYGRATLLVARQDPGCHLGWTTLAGVGTIESANGTIGGRRLLTTGYADRPITGPALDGVGGYAAVQDGRNWARALGPMQFLSSTWQKWGADGDGDGRADVHDIYDASLAAAHYLCADGHDLATAEGWTAAIYSYNHSAEYVSQVHDAATVAAR